MLPDAKGDQEIVRELAGGQNRHTGLEPNVEPEPIRAVKEFAAKKRYVSFSLALDSLSLFKRD